MHDMYQQPKQNPYAGSTLFADGSSMRAPPAGAVAMAQGSLADTSGGRLGHTARIVQPGRALPLGDDGRPLGGSATIDAAQPMPANPFSVTMPVLRRGEERYNIYCSPCHGGSGDGAGMIAQRGFPAPPSFHTDKLRNAPDGHFYRVITNGYGVMYPYADRIVPADRWAIVAYIRALQLSQHAPRDNLQPQDLESLADSSAEGEPAQR
jgi:hypothetical protein